MMRLAACFAIGFCIEGAAWLLWPLRGHHAAAMAAAMVYCIVLIAARRGMPVRPLMVDLHLELQSTFFGVLAGFQLFEVYPKGTTWSLAAVNVLSVAAVAFVVGMLGTAGLLATRRLRRVARRPPAPSRLIIVCAAAALLAAPKLAGYNPRAGPPPPPPREPIYDASLNVDAAIVEAGEGGDRCVLLMLGGNWCGWCYRLHDLLNDDPAIRKLLDDRFRLIHVDIRANEGILERYQAAPRGYPFLIVLGPDGSLLATQNTDEFVGKGERHHDPGRVYAFLAGCLE